MEIVRVVKIGIFFGDIFNFVLEFEFKLGSL